MLTAEPTKPSALSEVSPAWIPMPTASGPPAAAWLAVACSRMARAQRMALLAEGKTT
jgi:hypothetical protein